MQVTWLARRSEYTTSRHVLAARAKPLEQQVADRMIERRQEYSLIVNSGNRIGRVNGWQYWEQILDCQTTVESCYLLKL